MGKGWSRVHLAMLGAVQLVAGCQPTTDPAPPEQPPAVIRLKAASATNVPGRVGEAVTPVPVVRAVCEDGGPAAGVTIWFSLDRGGQLSYPSTMTDAHGIATPGAWILGTAVGMYTLTAGIAGRSTSVSFSAYGWPGPIFQVVAFSGMGQMGRPGDVIPLPLRVKLEDRYGNAVPSWPVRFRVLQGGGALAHQESLSEHNGIATSGFWTLGPAEGYQAVEAEAEGKVVVFQALTCGCEHWELAFVRDGNLFARTLLVEDEGRASPGPERQLTFDGARNEGPAWSADGSRLAFAKRGTDWIGDIYLMNADGSDQALLARGTGPSEEGAIGGLRSPAWSPDGRMLAFTNGDCIYNCEILLRTTDLQDAPVTRLAEMAGSPSWSPDGRRIAYVSLSGDDGYHELQVVDANGTNMQVLSPRDRGGIYQTSWSPDGRQIAFGKCLGACQIWLVAADGSGLRQLTNAPLAMRLGHPVWSPDGAWLAITIWDDQGDHVLGIVSARTGVGPFHLWRGHSAATRPGGSR